MVIFRCCLQWKAFQADRTSLFDKIINTMGTQVLSTCTEVPTCLVFRYCPCCCQTHRVCRSCRANAACVLQIEAQQENNACLGYWLSNTVTLLYLLQKNIKPASGGTYTSRVRSPGSSR